MDWIRKYLIDASLAFLVSLENPIIGIKDKILSSRPNQILNIDEEEITIKVLAIRKNI